MASKWWVALACATLVVSCHNSAPTSRIPDPAFTPQATVPRYNLGLLISGLDNGTYVYLTNNGRYLTPYTNGGYQILVQQPLEHLTR